MLTMSSRRHIVNLDRYIKVNFPSRLATTLVSLVLKLSIRVRDLSDYLSRCLALQHLEWAVSPVPSLITEAWPHEIAED
jgi:hypothetical protein